MARCACGRYPETGSSRCFWCIQLGVLSLKIGASEAEIKARRLKIVNMYHPDKWARDTKEKRDYANKRMQQANDAVAALKKRPLTPVPPAERQPEPVRETAPPQPERTETVKPWSYEEPTPSSWAEPAYEPAVENTYDQQPVQQNLDRWQSPSNTNGWPTYSAPRPKPYAKFRKAAPWILAGFLVLAAPPLLILWQRSTFPLPYAIAVFLAVIFVGYVLVKLGAGMWQYPMVRKVAPFLALWCAVWLLWTHTPLAGWLLSITKPAPQHQGIIPPRPQAAPIPKAKITHPPLKKTPSISKPSPSIKRNPDP